MVTTGIVSADLAERFAAEVWSKMDLKRYVWEKVRLKAKDILDPDYSPEDGVNAGIVAQ